ncbi:polyhomeotic-like protein 1 [Trichonephila clavata]|uniref:Polyhomeotic-like protein 1 n=1 Tax=Trichonephila clavata TaxID=2740835 RepID=A0A8X6KNB7_TRICU|nr:polyhomeotic-like protein 1 [Trichonephila clavata]
MAQAPSQQVQVIPQHLPSTQHQYVSQFVIPGNVTLQPGSIGATSLQSIGSAPGVSLQLQAKQGSGIQNAQHFQNAVLLQPKGPFNQVQNHIHLKHLPIRAPVASQASGTIYSHPQLIGSLALSPLPPGYSWASPNCYPQSHNPVILSREHPNIYLQSQPQTAVNLPVVTGQLMSSASLSSPVQVSQGVQTIATQTSAPSYLNSNPAYFSSQEPQKMHQVKAVTRMTYSRKAFKVNQKSQKSLEQNVGTSTQLQVFVNSGSSSDRLLRPNVLVSSQPTAQQTESKVITSTQTESISTETESSEAINNTVTDQSNQLCSPQLSQSVGALSSTNTTSVSQIGSYCTTTFDTAVTSTMSSATSAILSMPVISTEELSSDSMSQCDNSDHDANSEQSVPDSMKKPTSDVELVPDTSNLITNSKSKNSDESPIMSLTSKPNVQFNPVIKLKRLKPQQPIQTPYLRTNKDKQLQKAIVKPQMLSPVIDSYVVQEVTLKSVSDSSTIYHAEESNSDEKHDSVPIPSSGKENSSLIHEDDIPEEEPVRKFKVSRGRGRPRGRGRGRGRGRPPKRKQEEEEEEVELQLPLRRSLRQKGDVEFIGTVIGESATEIEASTSMIIENPVSSQMDCENVSPLNDLELDSSLESSIVGSISSETEKVATSAPGKSPDLWSVQEVFEFIVDFPGCAESAETFKSQEIDGQALLLMNLDHLMRGMSMKLGPALKLIAHINSMKNGLSS